MKKLRISALAVLLLATSILYSCGPNDNKGGMDQENSKGEGAVDSTRLPGFDSTSTSNSMDTTSVK